ncbi:hypothetical protein [Streptomyces sp. NBC_00829]|uniref:hypothetical protein n=1 Tax=Streptomyces sp. NBC_00829 TaxID=2903679 RepID=UPI00386678C7|nr:hypothetical protein OG293_18160 [Streptomyces sp. NBC_00829]
MFGRKAATDVENAVNQVLDNGGTKEQALAAGRKAASKHGTEELISGGLHIAADILRARKARR